MTKIQSFPFGTTRSGDAVTKYVLTDRDFSVSVLNYGGVIQSLSLPNRHGKLVDVVLGFNHISDYELHDKFLGAIMGRCANRIAGAQFTLDDTVYSLVQNEGANHLHGGNGFDRRIWQAQEDNGKLVLTLHSADGDEGYPGNLDVRVTYALCDHALSIDYYAKTDRATLCNLTNHAYFNLSGHASGNILDQEIALYASHYTPADAGSIPLGSLAPVEGTPMDLRQLRPIGEGILQNPTELQACGGYDHNWAVDGENGTLRTAAKAYSPLTGISMHMQTTLPGVQFYSGNSLDGCPCGKYGASYAKHSGFCLESQYYPDAIHHSAFPQPVLRPEDTYHAQTVYQFITRP